MIRSLFKAAKNFACSKAMQEVYCSPPVLLAIGGAGTAASVGNVNGSLGQLTIAGALATTAYWGAINSKTQWMVFAGMMVAQGSAGILGLYSHGVRFDHNSYLPDTATLINGAFLSYAVGQACTAWEKFTGKPPKSVLGFNMLYFTGGNAIFSLGNSSSLISHAISAAILGTGLTISFLKFKKDWPISKYVNPEPDSVAAQFTLPARYNVAFSWQNMIDAIANHQPLRAVGLGFIGLASMNYDRPQNKALRDILKRNLNTFRDAIMSSDGSSTNKTAPENAFKMHDALSSHLKQAASEFGTFVRESRSISHDFGSNGAFGSIKPRGILLGSAVAIAASTIIGIRNMPPSYDFSDSVQTVELTNQEKDWLALIKPYMDENYRHLASLYAPTENSPGIEIDENAPQPILRHPGEPIKSALERLNALFLAQQNEVERLYWQMRGVTSKNAYDRAFACDKSQQAVAKHASHGEAGTPIYSDTLEGRCLQPDRWKFKRWKLYCIQSTMDINGDVRTYTAYWQDQTNYKAPGGVTGDQWRFADRTQIPVRDNGGYGDITKPLQYVMDDHRAWDSTKPKIVNYPCVPLRDPVATPERPRTNYPQAYQIPIDQAIMRLTQ